MHIFISISLYIQSYNIIQYIYFSENKYGLKENISSTLNFLE